SVGVGGRMPSPGDVAPGERQAVVDALDFMGFAAGSPIEATPIDVAFIGSCTNSRLSDLREAAAIVQGHRVSPRVRAMVAPRAPGQSFTHQPPCVKKTSSILPCSPQRNPAYDS